jgi:hypothetical protein
MNRPKGYTASIRENETLYGKRAGIWPQGTKKWTVTLKNPAGKTMGFQYHTGPAVREKPTFNDVVQACITDGLFYEDNDTLEAFALESGFDLDDRDERKAAEKAFKACQSMSERTRALFGDDFDTLAYETAD